MINYGINIGLLFYQGHWETKIDSLYTLECRVVKNRRAEHEYLTTIFMRIQQNSSPNWFRKNNAHLFRLQILLQTLESIISHHNKSASISYNGKSEAILHLQLSFTNVSNLQSTHFSVENFSLFFFFSSFIQSNKKVKARCIKQKSEGHGLASAGVRIPLILDQQKASSSHVLSVSGILHWREGKRRKRWWRAGWRLSEVSTTTPPPLRSSSASLPKRSSVALRLADSASFLSVLKQDRIGLVSQMELIHNVMTLFHIRMGVFKITCFITAGRQLWFHVLVPNVARDCL